ncbi:MAG: hypothetical protein JJV95_02880 [Sulfurospirillum sp.]|nr:hypothetical protein [Sulfurospirillum sp.]MBL0702915.1 hypothetical protein [Sulfurospirillum sp.]
MTRVIICFIIVLVHVDISCADEFINYNFHTPKVQQHAERGNEVLTKDGTIKGIVVISDDDNGTWKYGVEGNDTSNQKLSYAKFTHESYLAKKGDYVYAIIEDSKLKEIFLINEANYKQKDGQKIVKKLSKTKKHQVLDVPTTQTIILD